MADQPPKDARDVVRCCCPAIDAAACVRIRYGLAFDDTEHPCECACHHRFEDDEDDDA